MNRIVELKTLPGYFLWLRFADGIEGRVDLSPLVGKGVFKAWEDPDRFAAVSLVDGIPVWGEAIDLCPDALYLDVTGKRPEDVFPALKRTAS